MEKKHLRRGRKKRGTGECKIERGGTERVIGRAE
jgi:hypothetical protein